jgi:hypothetical protein
MNRARLALVSATLTVAALIAFGQTSKGTLAGIVTDPSGATVANATVSAKDDLGPESRTVTTNSAGEYRIEAINPSTFTVSVSAPGFATSRIANVHVEGSVITSINAQLEVGTVGQTVEVSSAAATVQTESGELSKTVSTIEVQALPLLGLNPTSIVQTQPGVTTVVSAEQFTNGGATGADYSVNGLRPRSNNFLIDGFDDNDSGISGQALQPSNPEAVQEVSFLSNAYAPEYGHGGASVTNVIYQHGTNQYHGAGWNRYAASALDAIKSEEHQQGFTTPPQFVRNTFGFDVGGPVVKNKVFLFGTSQWDVFHYDESGQPLAIPTAQGISSLKSLGSNSNVNLLIDSLGGLVGPVNSSVNTINIGNRAGCGSPCLIQVSNFLRTPKAISNSYEYVIRGDYVASDRDTFSARFIGAHNSLTPDLFANPLALPTQDTFQGGPARNLGVYWTHVFGPNKINEVRFTDQTINFTFGLLGSTVNSPVAKDPAITIAGLTNGYNYGGEASTFPQGRGHDTFQYQEAFSWNVGSHNFKIGADFVHLGVTDQIPFNSLGTVAVVAGGDCSAIGLSKCTGLANFLDDFTGPSGSAGRQFGSSTVSFPQTLQNYYFQDAWKLRPNFTFTYGLRYEFQGTPFNGLPFPTVNRATVLSDPFPFRVLQQPDKNNFGPRAGFAWTPNMLKNIFGENKTVFRGGFGVFYDDLFSNIQDNIASSAPNVLGGSLSSPASGRGSSGLLNLVSGVTPVLNPKASISAAVSDLVNPLIYQWNFNIERQFPADFLATVAYVGTRGERLYMNQELNPGVNGVRLNPARGSIGTRTNMGNSSYNGLQTNLERRFTKGLLVRTTYTFSKAIDTASEVFAPFEASQISSYAQNPFNLGLDRGLSFFDHRHVFTTVWVYDLPFVKKNGALNYVTKGWRVVGSAILQSGEPTNIYTQFDTALTLRANERPNLGNPKAPINYTDACLSSPTCITGVGQIVDAAGTLVDWNTGAAGTFSQFRYIVPFQHAGNFGNLGRNTFENPGTAVWTLGASRFFSLPKLEGHRIEFRAEAFNPFNHANAGNLSGSVNDPNFLNKDVTFSGGRELRLWLFYRF